VEYVAVRVVPGSETLAGFKGIRRAQRGYPPAERVRPISTMPTSGLCRPLAQNCLWLRWSPRRSRH